jgi:hypothetical protein
MQGLLNDSRATGVTTRDKGEVTMPRYEPTDLTPKISLSVDESWYEKYWLTDRPEPAPARLWHKLRVALASHTILRGRLWPSLHLKGGYPSAGNAS